MTNKKVTDIEMITTQDDRIEALTNSFDGAMLHDTDRVG